jgi:Flp pilus assembly protein TadD
VIAVAIIGGGAYLFGHASGASVPGIDGGAALTNTGASPSATAAVAVDQAQVAALMKRIASDPKDAKSLRELGNLYYTASDFPNALKFYSKVVEVNPKDDDAWVAVGAAAFNNGDVEAAKSAWEQAVKVNPKNQEAHYDLGFAYLAQKVPDNDKAKAQWQTVVDLDPNSDWAKDAKSMLTQHVSGSGSPSASPSPTGS